MLPRSAPDSVRDQVLAAVQQYYADLSARDWQRFRDHFWNGATLTTVWQQPGDSMPRVNVTTVDRFIDLAPEGPGSREIFEEKLTSAEVRADDQLAQVWAKYEARFGDPGDVREWSGTDAFTLMLHEGRWRIVSVAYVSSS
ncbi:MAG: nuclear transport factor 2 family protein [Longimicrobiales bacterium]